MQMVALCTAHPCALDSPITGIFDDNCIHRYEQLLAVEWCKVQGTMLKTINKLVLICNIKSIRTCDFSLHFAVSLTPYCLGSRATHLSSLGQTKKPLVG